MRMGPSILVFEKRRGLLRKAIDIPGCTFDPLRLDGKRPVERRFGSGEGTLFGDGLWYVWLSVVLLDEFVWKGGIQETVDIDIVLDEFIVSFIVLSTAGRYISKGLEKVEEDSGEETEQKKDLHFLALDSGEFFGCFGVLVPRSKSYQQ